MKDFVRYLIQNIVEYPDQVRVDEIAGNSNLILEVSLAKSDMGKLIGKQGRNIEAVRTIIYAAAAKSGLRVQISIEE